MSTTDPAKLTELLHALDDLRSTLADALNTGARHLSPQPEPGVSTLAAMMMAAQSNILNNPAGAKGAVDALSQLGRAHAATPEGAELLDRIVASPQVAQLRTLWETVTLNVLDEIDEPSPIPAAWLDLVLDSAANEHLADAIAAVRPQGFA